MAVTVEAVTVDDVVAYTSGRLEDDDNTEALLARALAAARRYCGWHVTPQREDKDVVVDGPGSGLLVLPTAHLVDLKTVAEDGVDVDVETALKWSQSGLVRKTTGGWWTANYGGVVVTMIHGYDDGAGDFVTAVLEAVDQMSQLPGGSGLKRVDDVEYFQVGGFELDRSSLDPYRLEPLA